MASHNAEGIRVKVHKAHQFLVRVVIASQYILFIFAERGNFAVDDGLDERVLGRNHLV